MIATVYNATNIYLLDLVPEWSQGVKAKVELLSQADAGLSNREGRRAHGLTLRFTSYEFQILTSGIDARRVYGALRGYQAQPVAVPLWPAAVNWADRATAPINGGLKLVYRPVSTGPLLVWEIYEAAPVSFVPVATDIIVPLLWGRLDKREVTWLNADTLQIDIQFGEQGPAAYAITPAVVAWTAGPIPSLAYGAGPDLMPFTVDFDQATNFFTIDVIRDAIGFGRQPAETVYTQTVAREQELGHSLEGTEISQLLRFFMDHGAGSSFWASNWVSAARLTADIGALDTTIHVEDTYAVVNGDWLAFVIGTSAPTSQQVTGKTNTTIDLVAAVGALPADTTLVSHLQLCRFMKPQLELVWNTPEEAEARLPLRELPAEYNPAADETLGTTIGALARRCYLYEFTRTLGGVAITDRYTSFETQQAFGGNNYAPGMIEHGEIKKGIFLDRDVVEITTDRTLGGPLVQFALLRMEAPLFLVIRSADTDGAIATNTAIIFSGEITGASVTGNRLTAKAVPGSTLFDRKVPSFRLQLGCNYALFSPGCTMVRADWKFSATLNATPPGSYPFAFALNNIAGVGARAIAALAANAVFANWFCGGWIEFGAAATWSPRAILQSTTIVLGVMTVTTDRDPFPLPVHNDAVFLYPGCDGAASTCQAYDAVKNPTGKFDNYLNFGGHPFLPVANPTIVAPAPSTGGGKK